MFQFCFYNDSVSRVKLDLSRKETFSRCKFRFGILAIIVVTEFEWTLLTTTLQLLLRANLWMLLLLSVGEFVTVIVNAESNTQDCLSTNWNDLILEAAMCNVWDVLIMSLRAMQGHTQTWSSLVKYKFVLVCRSGPWLVLGNLIRENNLKGDIFLKITFHARITVYIWPTVIDQVSSSDFFHWKDLMLKDTMETS